MSPEQALIAALLLPGLGALAVSLLGRAPNLREAASILTAISLFVVVAVITRAQFAGAPPQLTLYELLPGIPIRFVVEPLGVLFALIASALWIVSTIYAIGYMRGNSEPHQTRFFACFALSIAATIGIAFAGNLLTLFLFYELLTLATYPLVTHHGDDKARRGGRIYLGVLLATSIGLFLPAIIATYVIAGTLEFKLGGILAGKISEGAAAGLLALYMFGIGKAALMPVHRWLPAAMVAPTPVSALLHAVAVVKAGVFTVVKVVLYVFGAQSFGADTFGWLTWVAGLTILIASVIALRADNLKRRLAYSTVSQLSYVVLAVAILAPLSVLGAILHIAAHAVGKITLFFAAGAIYTAAHKTEISQFDGIGRRMPITMGAFAIGAISMIGLPPAAGFLSKWYMVSGAYQAQHWFALGIIVLSTLLNAGYFLPIIYRAFFRHAPDGDAAHGEAPQAILIALVATSTLTLLLFFAADVPLALGKLLIGG